MSNIYDNPPLLNYLNRRSYTRYSSAFANKLAKDTPEIVNSLDKIQILPGHTGCVNTLSWNEEGDYLLSGSDDLHLNIHRYDGEFHLVNSILSGHNHNIFNAKFLPNSNNSKIVSCSCDYSVIYTEVNYPSTYGKHKFMCHSSIPYDVAVVNEEPYSFFVCSRQGTVRHYDLRVKTSCNCSSCSDDIIINSSSAIHAIDISPIRPYEIALGLGNNNIEFFDRRKISDSADSVDSSDSDRCMLQYRNLSTSNNFSGITSIKYSEDGSELICNYVGNKILVISCDPVNKKEDSSFDAVPEYFSRTSFFDYNMKYDPVEDDRDTKISSQPTSLQQNKNMDKLFGKSKMRNKIFGQVEYPGSSFLTQRRFEPKYQQTFTGHSNTKTILKEAAFWGKKYIIAGSDCGNVFIWDRSTEKVCNVLVGDENVVNVVQPHPTLPIFGCSGIDSTIKIFGPSVNKPIRKSKIQEAISRCSHIIDREQQLFRIHFVNISLTDFILPTDDDTNPETFEIMSDFPTDEDVE